jgi:hypothetical protein
MIVADTRRVGVSNRGLVCLVESLDGSRLNPSVKSGAQWPDLDSGHAGAPVFQSTRTERRVDSPGAGQTESVFCGDAANGSIEREL